ncbi:MAG: hypothetical protein ACFFC3_03570 [Candidatus Odinarchaeota archaeon]
MVKLKSRILFGISLSIITLIIISSFFTNVSAASYSRGIKVTGYKEIEPMILDDKFWISAELDITTKSGTQGQIIDTYSGDWDFRGERYWIVWPFWYVEWRCGSTSEVYTIEVNGYGEIISVRYSLTVRVYQSDGSPHTWFNLWVKIYPNGVKENSFSCWDDGIGYLYLMSTF